MNAELIREEIVRMLANVNDEDLLIRILLLLAMHTNRNRKKLN